MPDANAHDPSLNMVQLLHSGRSARENLLQGGWQPTPAMMLSSTHRAKLYSGDTSHRLPGRFSFSCLIAWHCIDTILGIFWYNFVFVPSYKLEPLHHYKDLI